MAKIPQRLEDLYPATVVEKLLETLHNPAVKGRVREALEKVGLKDVKPLDQMQQAWRQARNWLDALTGDAISTREPSLLNATGSLFHSDIAHIPLSPTVTHALATYTQFLNPRVVDSKLMATADNLFPGHAMLMDANLRSSLASLLRRHSVLIAKVDLVRIPGLGDISTILSGESTYEVGASNQCGLVDWQRALEETFPKPPCLLLVSPNCLTAEAAKNFQAEALKAAHDRQVPVYQILADAVIHPKLADTFQLPKIADSLDAGVEVVLAPLNLLLGGPAGILTVGQEQTIRRLAAEAELCGSTLPHPAQLAANIALQFAHLGDEVDSGVATSLLLNVENLRNRAARLAIQLNNTDIIQDATPIHRTVDLGPAPWNRYRLENHAVELKLRLPADEVRTALLAGKSSVHSNPSPSDEAAPSLPQAVAVDQVGERLVVDLRFIAPQDDHHLVLALTQ